MCVCYLCDTELSKENSSFEHIIPNALGGRLVSNKILCQKCNSSFGNSIDSYLAKQMNTMTNFLMIERERGELQSVRVKIVETNEEVIIQSNGIPVFSKPNIVENIQDNKVELKISARNAKEMEKILAGFTKKYPQLDNKEFLNRMEEKEIIAPKVTYEFSLGGIETFRAICKIVINFYLHNNGEIKYIKHLIPFVKGHSDINCVWAYYPSSPLYQHKEGEVSHIIKIIGDPIEKLLYGYIELFNTHNYIILINDNYNGAQIDFKYIFDVLKISVLDTDFIISITKNFLIEILRLKTQPNFSEIQKRFERVLSIGYFRQRQNYIKRIIDDAITKIFAGKPVGSLITQEEIFNLSREIAKKIVASQLSIK